MPSCRKILAIGIVRADLGQAIIGQPGALVRAEKLVDGIAIGNGNVQPGSLRRCQGQMAGLVLLEIKLGVFVERKTGIADGAETFLAGIFDKLLRGQVGWIKTHLHHFLAADPACICANYADELG